MTDNKEQAMTLGKSVICEAVKSAIEARKDEIIEVGRHIWQNPEPGYREVKTSAYLADRLRSLGLDVKTGLAMTGFRADKIGRAHV